MKEYENLFDYAMSKKLSHRGIDELMRLKDESEESHKDEYIRDFAWIIFDKLVKHDIPLEDVVKNDDSHAESIRILKEDYGISIEDELSQLKCKYMKITVSDVINKFDKAFHNRDK